MTARDNSPSEARTAEEVGTFGLGPDAALQLAQVARRFYLQEWSKQDIARELGLTRFKVARLLQQARDTGVVRIEVASPALIDPELSERLAAVYRLRRAIVLDVPDVSEPELRGHLARVAADLLGEVITETDVLGIGYGRTLHETTTALRRLAPCTAVQLSGALLGVHVDETSIELIRRVAAVSGGPAYAFYTPQVLPDPVTAEALRRTPPVAEAYRRYSEITTAVVAVGSWRPAHSLLYEALAEPERAELLARGAVAEVCATLVDADGNDVAPDFTDRCIAIRGDQLRDIDEVIAVAGGHDKTAAIRAVLRGGYASSLITDRGVAHHLLADAERAS